MLEQFATWTEVSTSMSIDDVMDLCDSADAYFDAMHDEGGKPPPTNHTRPTNPPKRTARR